MGTGAVTVPRAGALKNLTGLYTMGEYILMILLLVDGLLRDEMKGRDLVGAELVEELLDDDLVGDDSAGVGRRLGFDTGRFKFLVDKVLLVLVELEAGLGSLVFFGALRSLFSTSVSLVSEASWGLGPFLRAARMAEMSRGFEGS